MQNQESETLFARMMASGDRLIGTQREEERFAAIYSRHETPKNLHHWLEARDAVAILAADYLAAVREWRFDMEGETLRHSIARTGAGHPCRSARQPFLF